MNQSTAEQTAAIAAAGYPAAREAFERALEACGLKLKQSDLALAEEVLDLDLSDIPDVSDSPFDLGAMVADTALFSRSGGPLASGRRKRAIDRIAPKIPAKRDHLLAAVAARLPHAFFSVFEVDRRHPEGGILVKDLLDDGRSFHLMDDVIAGRVRPGMVLAGRLVDLGPWLVSFASVMVLRKSEAVAILIAMSSGGDLADRRDVLHELVYACRIQGADLVLAALEPMISVMALAIDQAESGPVELVASLLSVMDEGLADAPG